MSIHDDILDLDDFFAEYVSNYPHQKDIQLAWERVVKWAILSINYSQAISDEIAPEEDSNDE